MHEFTKRNTHKCFMISYVKRDDATQKTRKSLSNKIRIRFQKRFHIIKIYTALESFLCAFLLLFPLQIWSPFFVQSFRHLNIWHAMCNAIQCAKRTWNDIHAKNGWNQMIFCLHSALHVLVLVHTALSLECASALHRARQNHKSTVPLLVFCWLVCTACTNNE